MSDALRSLINEAILDKLSESDGASAPKSWGDRVGNNGELRHHKGDSDHSFSDDHDDEGSYRALDKRIAHAQKKGYKINHNIPSKATGHYGDHRQPDVTVHYGHDDEDGAHAYTVHQHGAAANDSVLRNDHKLLVKTQH